MELRQAILKAADQIERNPDVFNYWKTSVPPCGSPGCAIGLVAAHLGFREGLYVSMNCHRILGVDSHTFYARMGDAATSIDAAKVWMHYPLLAAQSLRLYADKYHPQEGIEEIRAIPDAVRHIFDMTPGELAEALSAA